MVTFLRNSYAPTGKFTFMNNFCSLNGMEMKKGEVLEGYMCRICDAITLFGVVNVVLH